MKSKKVILQGVGDEIQKHNLVMNPDEFIRIVHLPAAQSRFFQQGIEHNPRSFRLGVGEPRYDAAGGRKLLDAAMTWASFLAPRKSSIAKLTLARPGQAFADD